MTTYTARYTKHFTSGILAGLTYPTVESNLTAGGIERLREWATEHATTPAPAVFGSSDYTISDLVVTED